MCCFVNPFAKNRKRSWPLPKVGACIRALQQREQYAEAEFFVNWSAVGSGKHSRDDCRRGINSCATVHRAG